MVVQYWYSKEAVTNLANSNEPAIIITCVAAPANNLLSPKTEQNAALPATDNAERAIINQAMLRAVYNVNDKWILQLQTIFVGEAQRNPNDSRNKVDKYYDTDLILYGKNEKVELL